MAGRKTLYLGDSHTNGSGASNATFAFPAVSGRMAGTELVSVVREGYPGERSSQLLDRVDGLIATHTPGKAFIMCGTNDAGQGVTPEVFISNLKAIKAKFDAAGITISVGYVPPRGATSPLAARQLAVAYNLQIHRWATDAGVPVADTFSAVVDKATGAMAAAYDSGDAVHFNDAGHEALARAIAPVVVGLTKPAPWPVVAHGLGLLENALNDTVVGGWDAVSGAPTAVYADPVPGDGLTAGKWYTMSLDNTAGTGWTSAVRSQDVDQARINVGDQLVAFFKLKTSGGARVAARWISGTTTVSNVVDGIYLDVPLSGYISNPYTVTAGDKTRFRFGFSVTAPPGVSGSASMGQLEVYNLTTGGLVGLY